MPDPVNLPEGCNFYPRCDKAMNICKDNNPLPRKINGQQVRCHLYEEGEV